MSTQIIDETQKGEILKLELRRVIRASRERVFAAWTKPDEMRKWMGPGAISLAEVDTDPRTGGSYRMVMKGSPEGDPELAERLQPVEGFYTLVVPNELLCFTWMPSWNPGEESLVTVRFYDVEGGTELVLTHERFATSQSCNGHTKGWTGTLEKLSRYIDS